METVVPVPPVAASPRAIASPWHTALLLFVQALVAYRGMTRAGQLRELVAPDRIALYRRTIFYEWLALAIVLVGVWLHGSSLYSVMGERWRSLRQVMRDAGIAVLFLMGSLALDSILGPHLRGDGDQAVQFLLPRTRSEIALWMFLSLSAGICEEAVFRGYLQRQFMALTRSAPAGILLAAIAFGVSHLYQGVGGAVQIALLGAFGGIVAHWCGTVRPGMVAHTLQDVLGGLVRH